MTTVGVLGGGQLGRMMAVAALQLGYRVVGFAPEGDNVAADACSGFITAEWDDAAALGQFAAACDVVTWEFENVPVSTVAALPEALLACPVRALEVALGRPAGDIEARAAGLRLGKDKRGAAGRGRPMPRWTREDERRLRRMYGVHSNLVIAAELGRSVASVTNKAGQLGLVKAPAARSQAGRANVARRWNAAPGS